MTPLSVNETIKRLTELSGQRVSVKGRLSLEFEGTCVEHVPKSENLDTGAGTFGSSIWVDFDLTAINQSEQWLQQFDGRHVCLTGLLAAPDPEFGGCGHFSMWPAALIVDGISML